MKLHKALKIKNRIIGDINRIKGLIQRDNSKKSDKYDAVAVSGYFVELDQSIDALISLKSRIQIATAPISHKLLAMAEYKGQLTWYPDLSVKDGTYEETNYRTNAVVTEQWAAYFTQDMVDAKLVFLQKKVEALQDEIDEHNATTDI
tara:strand:+ start:94 stop:534 length:441 start_codon:yes stop_codon:yes gene_type:complete